MPIDALLIQNRANAHITRICVDDEMGAEVRQGQNRCSSEIVFEYLEGCLCCFSPLVDNALLEELSEKLRDHRIVLNELAVVPEDADEAPQLLLVRWCWPVTD
jgi:hypothetical protein